MSYCKIYFRDTIYEVKRYFKDVECKILHREDGPAEEYKSGTKKWFLNGALHRVDGPAIIYCGRDLDNQRFPKKREVYYLNGVEYLKKDYWTIIKFGGFV